ncbi:unnamed protein product [Caenorhabditis auriculariae]|uniref:C2 domain-containing protein n=1 Tax=Caenorhabditis auriculariae TaxID=2777116 RepID=A0A8S1GQ70_9PELO|nr:unnamed protein product [Caenorhabditis auriculariae]
MDYEEPLIDRIQSTPETFVLFFSSTVIVIVVVAVGLLIKTRQRNNWYDQNILDMSTEPPMRVRCASFNRMDTEDDVPFEPAASYLDQMRDRSALSLPLPKGDLSGLFTIPQAKKKNRSMFTNPHQNQLDRGMYQCQMADESACSSMTMVSTGSMHLSVHHDPNLSLLTVSLKQAIDLPSKRDEDNPNPYFRVALEVPEASVPKVEHQTKTFTSTSSPTIEEDFCFQVTSAQLSQCRLEIMVYDFDQFSVDECVGCCWLTLGRLNVSLDQNAPTVFWAEVLPFDENEGKGHGELLISLAYLSHAQRLSLNIFKVRNIRRNEGNICLRVTLLSGIEKKLKRKKTSSRKLTRSVQFNESLTFSIPKHTLCDVLLEIELVLETGTFGMATQTLARLQLPLHKCKDLWRAIIREEKSQARWHSFEQP